MWRDRLPSAKGVPVCVGIERLTSIMAEARSAMHSHDVDATIEGINNVIDGLSALEEEYQRGGAGSAPFPLH